MHFLLDVFCLAIFLIVYNQACNPGCYNDDCDEYGKCKQCIPGYFGDYCNTCSSGYYKNRGQCFSCPADCKECLPDTTCTVCKYGWYGKTCSTPCPTNCNTQICNIIDGSCTCKQGYNGTRCDQCPLGWYWNDAYERCDRCLDNCKICSTRMNCSQCKAGWYGQTCGSRCSINCNTQACNINDGSCSCKQGYTGTLCNQCSVGWYMNNQYTRCDRCLENCKVCSANRKCSECKTGWYGQTCGSRCSNNCNTQDCKQGYTGTRCDQCASEWYWSGRLCARCPEKCKECSSHRMCSECRTGWYDQTCGSRCPTNCNTQDCNINDGSCNCKHGYTGTLCNQCSYGWFDVNGQCRHCPPHCKRCVSNTSCGSCAAGYYGDICQSKCSAGCKGIPTSCNKFNGTCKNGCIDGRWGVYCKKPCPESCIICSSNTSCKACVAGYYGTECQLRCSKGCADQCDRHSGECNSCSAEYSGKKKCCARNNNCKVCSSNTECSTCVQGFHGSACAMKCSENCGGYCDKSTGECTGSLEPSQSTNSRVIAGAVTGVCVLIVIAIIAVFIIIQRRRRRKVRLNANEQISVNQETNIPLNAVETVDENTPASVSGLNSAPNAERRSALSKAETTAIENHTSRMDLTLSGLDDITVSLEERGEKVDDVEGKSTGETYYNFEAISRKGIAIDKLSDYVAGKSKQELIKEFLSVPKDFSKPYSDSQKPENLGKNRYRGIYPYDANRVRLLTGNSDYINASYINGFRKEKEYIAALGPLDVTTNHFITFWTMVWQEMVEKIVMLTKLVENTKMKCEQYWPDSGSSALYGDVSVGSMAEEQYADFTVRIFSVTKNSEKRMLYHFHYTAWPDQGVPDDVTGLIEFRNKVLAIKSSFEGAMIVHCSAGVGRTGTYIALDYLTKEGEETGSVNILACFASLRDQRVFMVQAEEQYIYLHDAVVHSLTYESHPVHSEKFKDYLKTLDPQTLQTKFDKLQLGMDRKDEAEVIAVNRNKTFKTKNHPQADIPGDRYRPKLYLSKTLGDSDYINAVYLDSFRRRNHYVVTQTPLSETLEDFLTLVYQEKCPCIVDMQPSMHTTPSITEYLPADGQRSKFGSFEIESVKVKSNEQFVLSRITLSRKTKVPSGQEQLTVQHYKYTGWDQRLAVPQSPANFITFVREVEAKSKQDFDDGKILLHCISGAERSCLFSAVSVMLEKMESEHEVSTVNVIRQIKSRRPTAIPTVEQYLFCHQCVGAFLDTFDTYSNFAARQ